mmetsp:Transcript_9225/g.22828  ORF Transcript_9225/g.22828 Transcript_9225/m.22828 type:complete len:259 (-) Transcript_9225:1632-2408(-)
MAASRRRPAWRQPGWPWPRAPRPPAARAPRARAPRRPRAAASARTAAARATHLPSTTPCLRSTLTRSRTWPTARTLTLTVTAATWELLVLPLQRPLQGQRRWVSGRSSCSRRARAGRSAARGCSSAQQPSRPPACWRALMPMMRRVRRVRRLRVQRQRCRLHNCTCSSSSWPWRSSRLCRLATAVSWACSRSTPPLATSLCRATWPRCRCSCSSSRRASRRCKSARPCSCTSCSSVRCSSSSRPCIMVRRPCSSSSRC